MALTAADRCCICAHPINSPQCPHPWATSFSSWPQHLLGELKRMLPSTRHPGS
jgi:hypothetical protein